MLDLAWDDSRLTEIMKQEAIFDFNALSKDDFDKVATEIAYRKMFDTDGSGKLSPLQKLMMKYDADKSGAFSVNEVQTIVHELRESEKDKSRLMKLLGVVAVVYILTLGCIFAVSLGATEASKENHVSGGEMVDLEGNAVRTDTVESVADMWDLPTVDIVDLAYMKHVTFDIYDSTAWTAAAFKVAGAYSLGSDTSTHVYVITGDGGRLYINSDEPKATFTTSSGAVYNVSFDATSAMRRRLSEGEVLPSMEPTTPPGVIRSRAEILPNGPQRRILRRGGGMRHTGTFTLSSGGNAGGAL